MFIAKKLFLITFFNFALFFLISLVGHQVSLNAKSDAPDMNNQWKDFHRLTLSDTIAEYYPYANCFKKASDRYNIPVILLLSVAKGESDFDPKDKSPANCHGIMQIQWPDTARDLGFKSKYQLYEPCRNIMAGARYLKKLLDMHHGNIHLALAAYNYGPTRIHAGISPGIVPEGAQWYSGYIFHHMKGIINRERALKRGEKVVFYKRSRKLAIITFNEIFRAEGFIEYIRGKEPSVRLEWFKAPFNRYSVVMLFNSSNEKRKSIKSMAKIGFKVDESKEF